MSLKSLTLCSVSAVVVLVAGLAVAEEKAGAKADLDHYLPIRTALAGDKLDGVKEHAQALGKSADKQVAKAAKALADAGDLAGARKAFGEVSKALLAEVDAAVKKGEPLGKLYVFECPMAKPYGRWIQAEEELGNPYYGSAMLKCGKKVAAIGEGGGDPHGEGQGHGGHDHGGHGGH